MDSVEDPSVEKKIQMEQSLVGSVNWYDNACLALLGTDRLAFSSRIFIFLAKYEEQSESSKNLSRLLPTSFFPAHHERVSGLVAMNRENNADHTSGSVLGDLVSCGHDGLVKIWSSREQCCIRERNLSAKEQTKLSTLDVSELPGGAGWRIVIGSELGSLFVWTLQGEREDVVTTKKEKDHIVVLQWEPVSVKNNVEIKRFAAGFKKGLIVIYKLDRGSSGSSTSAGSDTIEQITRIKAHEMDICSLAWCTASEIVGDLVTAGKEKSVTLWNLETNSVVKNQKLPGNNAAWISVCCTHDGHIIVSNVQGVLSVWDLSSNKLQFFDNSKHSRGHTRQVFSIRELPAASKQSPSRLITTSMDRSIAVWDLEKKKTIIWTPTLGGFVYTLASSSVGGGSMIAVGTGDNIIRLWRMSASNVAYDVTSVWNGINGRVTALAWHPQKEGLLGFGTDDGRVGIVNTLQERKQARLSNSHHKGTVFMVTWGPRLVSTAMENNGTCEDWLFLYSVGNYCLLAHDTGRLAEEEAVDVGSQLYKDIGVTNAKMDIAEATFRSPNLDYLALGRANGSVLIIRVHPVRLLATLTSHKKSINRLRWHPNHLTGWLAIASNDRFVSVTDLSGIIAKFDGFVNDGKLDDWKPVTVTDCLVKLEGHTQRVTDLAWSPHDPDRLLSASFDGAGVVWQVGSAHAECTFRGHHGRLFSCLWSAKDPDLVLTGGEDHNLLTWRPSLQPRGGPPKIKKDRVVKCLSQTNESGTTETPDTINQTEAQEALPDSSAEQQTLTTIPTAEGDVPQTPPQEVDSKQKLHRRKRPSLFARTLQSESADHTEGTLVLARYLHRLSSSLPPYLAHLSSREELLRHLEVEISGQLELDHIDNYLILLVWMGRVGTAVEQAWAKHHIPDWFMTVACLCTASGGGRNVDFRLVESKVQEIMKTDVLLAATYFLAVHRTREAINLLTSGQRYKEALVLITLRLSGEDKLREEVLLQLAEKESRHGVYDMAARSYLVLRRLDEATALMVRRQDRKSFWTAARVLRILEDQDAHRECMLQLLNWCFLSEKESLTDLRADFLSEELHQYVLLVDIFSAMQTDKCPLTLLHDMTEAALNQDPNLLSALGEDLLIAAESRQKAILWKQAFIYLVHDVFLSLCHFAVESDTDHDRLWDSLKMCNYIDPKATLQLATRLVESTSISSCKDGSLKDSSVTLPNYVHCLLQLFKKFVDSTTPAT